jgi:multidrug efflux pump subunit AcrB
VAGDIDSRLAKMSFPLEHRAELLGEVVERDKARQRIAGIAVASAIGIFLLLQACFASWTLAALAFFAIAVSVAGGGIAAAIAGGGGSLGTMIGLLGVVGIAARNAIVVFERYRLPARSNGTDAGIEPAAGSAGGAIAAIVASSAAVAAALLPFAVVGKLPGMEIAQPIAMAMFGGLVASLLVTMLVLPALFLRAQLVAR